ncbi:carbonic anhydrase [Sarcoptes scabiei]|nr:carbonic anhydrase [Sarcoptes scabiei]
MKEFKENVFRKNFIKKPDKSPKRSNDSRFHFKPLCKQSNSVETNEDQSLSSNKKYGQEYFDAFPALSSSSNSNFSSSTSTTVCSATVRKCLLPNQSSCQSVFEGSVFPGALSSRNDSISEDILNTVSNRNFSDSSDFQCWNGKKIIQNIVQNKSKSNFSSADNSNNSLKSPVKFPSNPKSVLQFKSSLLGNKSRPGLIVNHASFDICDSLTGDTKESNFTTLKKFSIAENSRNNLPDPKNRSENNYAIINDKQDSLYLNSSKESTKSIDQSRNEISCNNNNGSLSNCEMNKIYRLMPAFLNPNQINFNFDSIEISNEKIRSTIDESGSNVNVQKNIIETKNSEKGVFFSDQNICNERESNQNLIVAEENIINKLPIQSNSENNISNLCSNLNKNENLFSTLEKLIIEEPILNTSDSILDRNFSSEANSNHSHQKSSKCTFNNQQNEPSIDFIDVPSAELHEKELRNENVIRNLCTIELNKEDGNPTLLRLIYEWQQNYGSIEDFEISSDRPDSFYYKNHSHSFSDRQTSNSLYSNNIHSKRYCELSAIKNCDFVQIENIKALSSAWDADSTLGYVNFSPTSIKFKSFLFEEISSLFDFSKSTGNSGLTILDNQCISESKSDELIITKDQSQTFSYEKDSEVESKISPTSSSTESNLDFRQDCQNFNFNCQDFGLCKDDYFDMEKFVDDLLLSRDIHLDRIDWNNDTTSEIEIDQPSMPYSKRYKLKSKSSTGREKVSNLASTQNLTASECNYNSDDYMNGHVVMSNNYINFIHPSNHEHFYRPYTLEDSNHIEYSDSITQALDGHFAYEDEIHLELEPYGNALYDLDGYLINMPNKNSRNDLQIPDAMTLINQKNLSLNNDGIHLKFKLENRFLVPDSEHRPFQKPCAFFLENACARVDCKFSHDISSIPCKYFMDGVCYKDEFCPFLHDKKQVSV